jgi:lysozyme
MESTTMVKNLQPSPACLDLVKRFESCRLTVYDDQNGIPTIGWGHRLRPEEMHLYSITQAIADHMLACDLQSAANDVNTMVHVQVTQGQFDALCSFDFNIGGGRFRTSTMLIYLNANRIYDASNEFLKWDHAAGKVSDGLETRRQAERKLFLG